MNKAEYINKLISEWIEIYQETDKRTKKAVWKDAPFKPVKGRIVAEGKGYYYDFKTGKSEDMYFLNFEGYPIEYGVWLRSKECDWDDYVEEKIWGEESPEVDDGQESEDK